MDALVSDQYSTCNLTVHAASFSFVEDGNTNGQFCCVEESIHNQIQQRTLPQSTTGCGEQGFPSVRRQRDSFEQQTLLLVRLNISLAAVTMKLQTPTPHAKHHGLFCHRFRSRHPRTIPGTLPLLDNP